MSALVEAVRSLQPELEIPDELFVYHGYRFLIKNIPEDNESVLSIHTAVCPGTGYSMVCRDKAKNSVAFLAMSPGIYKLFVIVVVGCEYGIVEKDIHVKYRPLDEYLDEDSEETENE